MTTMGHDMTPDHGPAGTLDQHDIVRYTTAPVGAPPRTHPTWEDHVLRAGPWIAAILPSPDGLHVSTAIWACVYRLPDEEIRRRKEEAEREAAAAQMAAVAARLATDDTRLEALWQRAVPAHLRIKSAWEGVGMLPLAELRKMAKAAGVKPWRWSTAELVVALNKWAASQ